MVGGIIDELGAYLNTSTHMSINFALPPEVLNHIFSFLSPYELTRIVSLVCYQFNLIASTNTLWKCLFTQLWYHEEYLLPPGSECGADVISWKYCFAKRSALEHNWATGNCNVLKYEGHTNWVNCFQATETYVVSGSDDNKLKIWDTDSANCIATLSGHRRGVACLYFEGDTLISGGGEGICKIWSISQQTCLKSHQVHEDWVNCLQVTDGKLYTGSDDGTIKIWDLTQDMTSPIQTLDLQQQGVFCLQAQGPLLVCGLENRRLEVYDTRQPLISCVRQLHGHNNGVYSLQLGEGGVGYQLASGSEEGVRLWDIRDGRCITTLTGHTRSVYTLMFRGNRLVTGAGDCAIKIWDLSDFSNVHTKRIHTAAVWCLSFTDECLYSSSAESVTCWDFSIR